MPMELCPATLCGEPFHYGKRDQSPISGDLSKLLRCFCEFLRALDAWLRIAICDCQFTETAVQGKGRLDGLMDPFPCGL